MTVANAFGALTAIDVFREAALTSLEKVPVHKDVVYGVVYLALIAVVVSPVVCFAGAWDLLRGGQAEEAPCERRRKWARVALLVLLAYGVYFTQSPLITYVAPSTPVSTTASVLLGLLRLSNELALILAAVWAAPIAAAILLRAAPDSPLTHISFAQRVGMVAGVLGLVRAVAEIVRTIFLTEFWFAPTTQSVLSGVSSMRLAALAAASGFLFVFATRLRRAVLTPPSPPC